MMIGENRHLADNATLNKHRKATSETYVRAVNYSPYHALVDNHPPLP